MKNQRIKFLIFLFAPLLLSSVAFAEDIGKFTSVDGKVDVVKMGRGEAINAARGEVVSVGDIVRTKSTSKAEITFTDNTILRFAENTRLEIKEYRIGEDGKRINAVINLQRGKIRAIVSKTNGKADFTINTPNASGNVMGTDIFVFYQKSSTGVLVVDGKFSAVNSVFPDEVVNIFSGNTSVIPADESPQEPRVYLAMELESHEEDTSPAAEQEVTAVEQEEPGQMKAVVVEVAGSVTVRSRGTLFWHDAKVNEVLSAGDEIETKEDGKIEIRLENRNIINLKPNTKLILQKLSQDLETGDYENLLECNIGKIRAQVEKIKGNSKFEIKTPTAVAAVRGTILYLNVLPNLTTAYFEGGNGALTNIISGITQVVSDGNQSSSDNQGNVSTPTPPSNVERSQWQEGWETEGGAEGYTPPGGGVGGGAGGDTGGGDDTKPFNQIPFTPPTTTTTTGTTTTTTTTSALNAAIIGNFGSFGSSETDIFESDESSSVDAVLTAPTTLAQWPLPSGPATLTGTYSNPNDQTLWWESELTGTDTSGGNLLGWIGGSWHSWEGVISSIYIDSSGIAGNIFGYMSGTTDETAGTLSGNGDLFVIPLAGTDILPANLSDSVTEGSGSGNLYISFNDGYLDAQFGREMMKIEGEPWGIWREIYNGSYDRPDDLPIDPDDDLAHWIGTAGGNYNEEGYFFIAFEGLDDLNGSLRIDLLGTYMDYAKLGAHYGTILGTYTPTDSYDFEGIGLGGFVEEPLAWSAEIDAYYHYYDYYWDELYAYSPHYGIMGAIQSPFESPGTPADITLMGEAYPDDYITWWGYLYGSYADDGSEIPDGFIGGRTSSIEGMLVSLYIDDAGNAGTLSGNFGGYYDEFGVWISTGDYYDELDMWMATGEMTAIQRATGYNPDDYDYDDTYIDGYIYGNFDNGGEIYSGNSIYDIGYGQLMSYTTWLIDPSTGNPEPWGIFNIELGGYFDYEDASDDWTLYLCGADWRDLDGEEYWFATVTGSQWSDQRIAGTLLGNYLTYTALGTIEGNVLGSYDTEDYDLWEAIALGTFEEEPLTFSGIWGGGYDGAYYYISGWSLYYNDDGYLGWAGEDYGLIGSTTPDWWNQGSFPILAMGEYLSEEVGYQPLIFNTPIFSYNGSDGYFTTQDGAAFYGFTAGLWKILHDEGIDGAVVAIYVAPADVEDVYNAGILRGDISGDYYSGLGMWMAEGTLKPTEMVQDIGISPEELEDYIDYGFLEAYVYGFFGNIESDSYIEGSDIWGQTSFINTFDREITWPWGIYDIKLEGADSYSNPGGLTIWLAQIGGEGEFGEYDYYDEYPDEDYPNGSWVGVTGGIWQNGEIKGALRALYVTDEHNAGLMEGDVFGLYDEIEAGYGTWIGESIGTFEKMDVTDVSRGDLEEFYGIKENEFFGGGLGNFAGGGTLETTSLEGISCNIFDQDWGIWAVYTEGSYKGPSSPYRLAAGGVATGGDMGEGAYWLATIFGDWGSETLNGELRGVWFGCKEFGDEGKQVFNAGPITGEIFGTYDEVDTTWQAAGVGEWVELAELDPDILGFDNVALAEMVEVPITEMYASLLTGAGGFGSAGDIGSITGAMDISFYADAATALSGIWASLINGSYSDYPGGNDWTLNLSDATGTNATLTGTQWNDGQWLADVNGTAPDSVSFAGQAGGTYTGTDSGTLTGVGAGTWQQGVQE
ncbi:MAG: hypothetical protein AMJ78_01925 [Omnitrophica WOR_2 bacterium SM23_29]|nr:MAG: hypothetical protein AMJ78_01925 [Omnitrophica WOR_2 bacterium SM23_29]